METSSRFLPMTRDEMATRGWRELDVLLVTGDAYFDHPSHGVAVIGRVLEAAGYRVGIVSRPDWRSVGDFKKLGRPALFAGVTAGAVDSVVSRFTALGAPRKTDAYAPGGKGGGRPDQATLVYGNRLREAFPKLPVVLGGIEASLRRFAYFDSLRGTIRRSILVDSRADILVYGPGEAQTLEIANRLAGGRGLEGIPGTARLVRDTSAPREQAGLELPDFDTIAADPFTLLRQTESLEWATRPGFSGRVTQRYAEGAVAAEPPQSADTDALDSIFALEFARRSHPLYSKPVPALETVRWSVISHRGCPGGCSFCGLAMHQGRQAISRSADSVLAEVAMLVKMPGFRGTITDIGGPTANAYGLTNQNPDACRTCRRRSCLHPRICKHLDAGHDALLSLLGQASSLPGVRHLFLASGIRHDLALEDPLFIDEVALRYTGGHLKVAPEHVAPEVLKRMRKPRIDRFEAFESRFLEASRRAGKEQYLVPYFISGFPGCTPKQADAVGLWLAKRGQRLEQVQSFMPLAGTSAAAMLACGRDERGNPIYLPNQKEQKRQKAVLNAPPSRGNRLRPRRG